MGKIQNFIKAEISGWSKFEIIFIPIILPLVLIMSLYVKDSIVATCSAIFGLLYTIIAGKGKISCYFFGIVGTICYSYLALKNALYGSLLLNFGYYFPMEIIGIFSWRKHLKQDNQEIQKTFLSYQKRILLIIITILLSLILSCILKNFNDKFPLLDGFITVLSITGMYLTVKRCIEQWAIWTLVNLLSVILWVIIFIQGGRTFATLLMWLIYLFLGIYFYFQWHKEIYQK